MNARHYMGLAIAVPLFAVGAGLLWGPLQVARDHFFETVALPEEEAILTKSDTPIDIQRTIVTARTRMADNAKSIIAARGYVGPAVAAAHLETLSDSAPQERDEIISPVSEKLAPEPAAAVQDVPIIKVIPLKNTLVIPSIGVNAELLEGKSEKILHKGIWHRPNTGNPESGGNMVLAGHRYMWKSGPNTFYHLPKMKAGDILQVFWKQKQYDYQITEVRKVAATAVEIEDPTPDHQLTLYTCTLLTAEERLVVKAVPMVTDQAKESQVALATDN